MPNLPTRGGRRKAGPLTAGTRQLPSSTHASGTTTAYDEDQLMQAMMRAEQRGGSVALLPTNGLPVWMCFRQHRFQLAVQSVLGGAWCEDCPESIGERVVRLHLERIRIDYRCEVSFPSLVHVEPLRFDFYVPSLRLFIEMDGEQHFGPAATFKGTLLDRLIKDQLKDDWVRQEGVSLLRIGYWELASVERLIDSVIARLRAGESALLVCWEAIVEWRRKAIKVLQSRHRAPPAPVPEDARQLAQKARKVRKEDTERCTEIRSAGATMPADILLSIA
jgi:very-short-patch-repair endonuclease